MKIKARVKPSGRQLHDQRKKVTDFYTNDQRLLAEIRDLLLILVNREGNAVPLLRAMERNTNELATLRFIIETTILNAVTESDEAEESAREKVA